MQHLTKQQVGALIEATARAGLDEQPTLRLAEQLLDAELLRPTELAYMRGEDLSAAGAAERFLIRVEASS